MALPRFSLANQHVNELGFTPAARDVIRNNASRRWSFTNAEPLGYIPPAKYEARYYEQAAVA